MKLSLYLNYVSRSLLRGGQRTILAIFCVAVGVMAIVALQLAGYMLQTSLSANVRIANGGDIAVSAPVVPLRDSDLSLFAHLKSTGTITAYTPLAAMNGFVSVTAPSSQSFAVSAVDPGSYPLVGTPDFVMPGTETVAQLLVHNQVIVTQDFLTAYDKHLGDALTIYIKNPRGSGVTLHTKIAGVVANSGPFAQTTNLVLIAAHDYQAVASIVPLTYNVVDITTASQSHTDAAVRAIEKQFPLASTQTAADALKAQRSSLDMINKFLEIAGLLALLIGGVGIVNTMQVLLSRRKTEIAMLKTTGYRRGDLYMLFGLEAALLGLIGGVVGALAAIGVSAIVRNLLQNLGVSVQFVLNPWIVVSGIAIGLLTSLIFGLLPIVQAATVRPLSVIRDFSDGKKGRSQFLTVLLLLLLSVLFCLLAIVILNNDILLGIEAVYGTFAFLLLLSAFFGLVLLLVSKLPVPEHFNVMHMVLVLVSVAASVLIYLELPAFGIILAVVSLFGILVVFLPRSMKVSTRMALRSINRQRTRTTTTVLALFIGIFTIGLVLALGQGLQDQLSTTFLQKMTYNIVVNTSGTDTTQLQSHMATIPGMSKSQRDNLVSVMPAEINGHPLQNVLPQNSDRQTVLGMLSTIEGYQLTQITPASSSIIEGRDLTAQDAHTNNVLVSAYLTPSGPFNMHLQPGDTLTLVSMDGKSNRTVNIVGVYSTKATFAHAGGILAASDTVSALVPAHTTVTTVTYMKIQQDQVTKALKQLGRIVPNAAVQNMADIGGYFSQELNNISTMLVAIASLSMLAGVIIIANTVTLAMLERRRELGILKAVGYTSGTILNEVMIENGLIGAVGAIFAMILAALAALVAGNALFSITISISPLVVVGLVSGAVLLAMLTAALVSWSAVRVRPLEVLRYE